MASCKVTPLISGSCHGHAGIYSSSLPTFIKVESASNLFQVPSDPSQKKPTSKPGKPKNIDKEEQRQITWILDKLSNEELETAARTSYEYLRYQGDSQQQRHRASSMARRYLQQAKRKHPKSQHHACASTLKNMRATLKFRRNIDIDGLRLAFEDPSSEYQEPLEEFLSTQKNYVMCYDKDGRSTHIFVPRYTQNHHPEWTLKESLYTMERAIACSKAEDKSVNVILDFAGFSYLTHSPRFLDGKEFLLTFRRHYVGQIHKIFILNPPAAFSLLWKIFQPFLGTLTQEKIVFCRGETQRQRILSQYYTPEQAADWMLPNGTKNPEWDAQRYLYKTPFDKAFDES